MLLCEKKATSKWIELTGFVVFVVADVIPLMVTLSGLIEMRDCSKIFSRIATVLLFANIFSGERSIGDLSFWDTSNFN